MYDLISLHKYTRIVHFYISDDEPQSNFVTYHTRLQQRSKFEMPSFEFFVEKPYASPVLQRGYQHLLNVARENKKAVFDTMPFDEHHKDLINFLFHNYQEFKLIFNFTLHKERYTLFAEFDSKKYNFFII